MSVGEYHPVAVKPARVLRVEFEVAGVERGGNFGHAQRHALVPLLGFDDRVDRQKTDGVRQGLLGVGAHVMSERLGRGPGPACLLWGQSMAGIFASPLHEDKR